MTACHTAKSKVKVKVTWRWKLEILPFSKSISSAVFNGSWQVNADSLTRGQYLNLFGFDICSSFSVTWLWTWTNLARRMSRPSVPHGANFSYVLLFIHRWHWSCWWWWRCWSLSLCGAISHFANRLVLCLWNSAASVATGCRGDTTWTTSPIDLRRHWIRAPEFPDITTKVRCR